MKSEKEIHIKAIRKALKTIKCDIKKHELRVKLKRLKKDVVKEEVREYVS